MTTRTNEGHNPFNTEMRASLACAVLAAAVAAAAAAPTAQTTYGAVIGSDGSHGTAVFLGVPFAAPPVGPLRWTAPVPPTPWQSPRNATSQPPVCMQTSELFQAAASEDCLYLNVFAPAAAVGGGAALPVMVRLHWG